MVFIIIIMIFIIILIFIIIKLNFTSFNYLNFI